MTAESRSQTDRILSEDPAYADMRYRDVFWPSRRYEDQCDRIAIRALLPKKGQRMAELGAGFGRLAGEYRNFDHVVLLDLSSVQLQAARDRLGSDARYEIVEGDVFHLPFDDASFDAIVCVRVIHHFADPRPAIAEMARVLRPGGVLVLESSNRRNLKAIILHLLRRQKESPFRRGTLNAPDSTFMPDSLRQRQAAAVEAGEVERPWSATTDFDHSPVDFRGWLRSSGFRIEKTRSVSNFRLPFVTRRLPLGLLVALERVGQPLFGPVTLGPSIVVRAIRERA